MQNQAGVIRPGTGFRTDSLRNLVFIIGFLSSFGKIVCSVLSRKEQQRQSGKECCMNKAFRVLWNAARKMYVAASELMGCGQSRGSGLTLEGGKLLLVTIGCLTIGYTVDAYANRQAGSVWIGEVEFRGWSNTVTVSSEEGEKLIFYINNRTSDIGSSTWSYSPSYYELFGKISPYGSGTIWTSLAADGGTGAFDLSCPGQNTSLTFTGGSVAGEFAFEQLAAGVGSTATITNDSKTQNLVFSKDVEAAIGSMSNEGATAST